MRVWLAPDGIVRGVAEPEIAATLVDTYEDFAAFRHVVAGKKRLLLADIRGIKSMVPESREFWSSPASRTLFTAVALIVEESGSEKIGRALVDAHAGHMPMCLFASESEALEWLRGIEDAT